jgi:hypothetical protein
MIHRNEDGSVTLTNEQYDDCQKKQRETLQTKKAQEARFVTFKCEDNSPKFDSETRTAIIIDEDKEKYYANNGLQYPKFAWKIIHEEAIRPVISVKDPMKKKTNKQRHNEKQRDIDNKDLQL